MITTIITTYHRPQLLKRAVESVLAQTVPSFKVCVYDNGSDDETKEIMESFLQKDPRIFYHRHPINIGMMENYAYGLSKVNTPYFSFLSDDDILRPDFYKMALTAFEEYPNAAFFACGTEIINEKGELVQKDPLSFWKREGIYKSFDGAVEMLRLIGRFPNPMCILFQSDVIKEMKIDLRKEVQLLWDPDYILRISIKYPIIIAKKIGGTYLAHSKGFSASYYAKLLQSSEDLETYLNAAKLILHGLLQESALMPTEKERLEKYYSHMIRSQIGKFIFRYISNNKISDANHALNILQSYFGNNIEIRFYASICSLINRISVLKYVFSFLFFFIKRNVSLLRKMRKYMHSK